MAIGSQMGCGRLFTPGTGATYYTTLTYSGGWTTLESYTQEVMLRAGTLRDFRVHRSQAPGPGNTETYTIRKNGVNTLLTIGLDATGTDAFVSASVQVAAGDLIAVSLLPVGTPTSGNLSWAVAYEEAPPLWLPGGGGTGHDTFSAGDTLHADAATTFAKLAIGPEGFVKTVEGGLPTWKALPPAPSVVESGVWVDRTAVRADNTIYQNTSGKKRRVLLLVRSPLGGQMAYDFFFDSVTPPATFFVRPNIRTNADAGLRQNCPLFTEIPNGWYYKGQIVLAGTEVYRWFECDE